MDRDAIKQILEQNGRTLVSMEPVSGGDIHRSYRVGLENGETLFAKLNDGQHGDVLAGEYRSLCRMVELGATGYPRAKSFEQFNGAAVLLMEYLPLSSMSGQSGSELADTVIQPHTISTEQ